MKIPWGTKPTEQAQLKRFGSEIALLRGGSKRPNPPRSIIAQPGSRKVVLDWMTDPGNFSNVQCNIYKDTERNLVATMLAGVTHYELSATAGANPPTINIFLSYQTPNGGIESRKVHVQCRALAETGAPSDPPPVSQPSGGGGGGSSRQPGRGQMLPY